MLSKNHPLIIFIDRFGFAVYQDLLTNIPKFSFTPDLVSNLDVVNKAQFLNLIITFIQINKMVPSSILIILSDNIIYIKDLVNSVPKAALPPGVKSDAGSEKYKDEDVQAFLEDVPFEDVMAKVLKMTNGARVVAVNKDLVISIVEAFRSKGFTVEGVVPAFIYSQRANFATGLTMENVKIVLEDSENLKVNNLLADQEKLVLPVLQSEVKAQVSEGKKSQNLRQYILIGVFVTLLVILAVVYLNMGVSQNPPIAKKTKAAASRVLTPTAIPTSIVINSGVSIDMKNINIKLTQGSQTAQKASEIKSNLIGMGVKNIIDEISASIPEKSSVIFSSDLSVEIRSSIIAEIRKTILEFSILEDQVLTSTINIIVGKS